MNFTGIVINMIGWTVIALFAWQRMQQKDKQPVYADHSKERIYRLQMGAELRLRELLVLGTIFFLIPFAVHLPYLLSGDSLVEGDVVVADMYDKIYKGTFLGGNLTTAIKTKTKTGGGVIWGGIRDTQQMKAVEGVQFYYRGIDPTPIRDFIMKDFNSVTRIGKATVLPGDIVYGAGGGVLFIPAHLVAEVVDGAAKTHVKDDFGFEMIAQNKFTTAQIDRATWTVEMLDMLTEWIRTDPRGEKYRDLDWSPEYDAARNGDPNDTQTML